MSNQIDWTEQERFTIALRLAEFSPPITRPQFLDAMSKALPPNRRIEIGSMDDVQSIIDFAEVIRHRIETIPPFRLVNIWKTFEPRDRVQQVKQRMRPRERRFARQRLVYYALPDPMRHVGGPAR